MKTFLLSICFAIVSSFAFGATNVWTNGDGDNLWINSANWSTSTVPDSDTKVVFNNVGAGDCFVTTADATCQKIVVGDGNPGGILRIKDGGVLTTTDGWSAVAFNADGKLIVDAGGVVNFASHLWIGLNAGGTGTVEVSGTINVTNAIGSDNGDPGNRTVLIKDGGVINIPGINALIFGPAETSSTSLYDIAKEGRMIVGGNVDSLQLVYMTDAITSGKLTASGGSATVMTFANAAANTTTFYNSTTSNPPVSVSEITTGAFDIYPNPASDMIYLKNITSADVRIFNIAGQNVLSQLNTSMVNVQALKPGLYFVNVLSNGINETHRLIKQ